MTAKFRSLTTIFCFLLGFTLYADNTLRINNRVVFGGNGLPAKNVRFQVFIHDSVPLGAAYSNDSGICRLDIAIKPGEVYLIQLSYDRFPKWGRYFEINAANLPPERLSKKFKGINFGFLLDTAHYRINLNYPSSNIVYHGKEKEFGYDHNSVAAMLFISKAVDLINKNVQESKRQDSILVRREFDSKLKESEIKKQTMMKNGFLIGLILLAVISFLIYRSLLENKRQKAIISAQKIEVEKQKKVVEEHQKEILDSIRYAKRIQTALLPSHKYINRVFSKDNRK